MIDFSELVFDPRAVSIGSGGYGEVFKGQWMGVTVAIKRFEKMKYVSKKALREFITEIEMLHGLRFPHIVLYMGVSFDD